MSGGVVFQSCDRAVSIHQSVIAYTRTWEGYLNDETPFVCLARQNTEYSRGSCVCFIQLAPSPWVKLPYFHGINYILIEWIGLDLTIGVKCKREKVGRDCYPSVQGDTKTAWLQIFQSLPYHGRFSLLSSDSPGVSCALLKDSVFITSWYLSSWWRFLFRTF